MHRGATFFSKKKSSPATGAAPTPLATAAAPTPLATAAVAVAVVAMVGSPAGVVAAAELPCDNKEGVTTTGEGMLTATGQEQRIEILRKKIYIIIIIMKFTQK